MILKTFVKGPIDANNYLLIDENTNNAILIDCSDDYADEIKRLGINLKYILLTHGHFDHILGCNSFFETFGCDIYVSQDDIEQIEYAPEMTYMLGGVRIPKITSVKKNVKDGDVFELGDVKIKAISTAGHTEGGMCYLTNNNELFSGDTIFHGSVGRTDFKGGDFEKLSHSVKDVLFRLPEETIVYPGHGAKTSIKFEKKFNEIIRG
ncbi:MBL fold metallo-hydrolase [bacterium]|nr:MBL fold metallo-hydrolase [bacterium]